MTQPRFPKNAKNGDIILDIYGNRWEYHLDSKSWISKGLITTPSLVTEDNNGLVTPEIHEKLKQLETYDQSKTSDKSLKIYPGTQAYWYYFRAGNKLFRFKPEGIDKLRIEIDKGRLYQILLKEICPGKKGERGETGDPGRDGIPGADEICFLPSEIEGNRLNFAIYVPTPLDENSPVPLPNNHIPDIAIRIYRVKGGITSSTEQSHYLLPWLKESGLTNDINRFHETRELILNKSSGIASAETYDIPLSPVARYHTDAIIDLDPIITIDINPENITQKSIISSIEIEEERTLESINFDVSTGIISGSIFIQDNWSEISDEFCIKARQRGPDGETGLPGEPRISIFECLLDSTNVRAVCPIINARLCCDRDDMIYILCSDLLEEICADLIQLVPGSDVLTNTGIFNSLFAAAEMSLDECKRINRYHIELPPDDVPELNLLHWDPQPGCFLSRHFDKHKFIWIPDTDIPACDSRGTWFDILKARSGKYPWKVHTASVPKDDECCQDHWFYCPNIQEPCIDTPLTTPAGPSGISDSRIYYGVLPSTTINNADVLLFSNQPLVANRSIVFDIIAFSQYIYICYPESFGDANFRVNGILNTAWTKTVLDPFVDSAGNTFRCNIYRSDNLLTGSYAVEVFW